MRWIERLLILVGCAALGVCAYIVIDMATAQASARRTMTALSHREAAGVSTMDASASQVWQLAIPRLGVSVMGEEGTDIGTLRRGAGHVPGTAPPGSSSGNVVIAAHRDTFFRPLRDIRVGDDVEMTTASGRLYYRVDSTEVVAPSDVAVLRGTGTPNLTLITCYPFAFIGSAPSRFIVHCSLVGQGHRGTDRGVAITPPARMARVRSI